MSLGEGLHLAHVVLDYDSIKAFVTAEETNEVIQVDATTFQMVRKFNLRAEHVPHVLRYAHDKLYAANTGAKKVGSIPKSVFR